MTAVVGQSWKFVPLGAAGGKRRWTGSWMCPSRTGHGDGERSSAVAASLLCFPERAKQDVLPAALRFAIHASRKPSAYFPLRLSNACVRRRDGFTAIRKAE